MRLPDEPRTQIYPQWPLMFKSIPLVAYATPLDPSGGVTLNAYLEAVERARAAEIVRARRSANQSPAPSRMGRVSFQSRGQEHGGPAHKGAQASEFPQAWILAERIARAIASLANQEIDKLNEALERGKSARAEGNPEQLLADFRALAEQAVSWVRRAQSAGLDAPTTKAEAKEYSDWLARLGSDERFEITYALSRALKRGMSAAIKYCGGSRKAGHWCQPPI
jgi:hypothetical protein